jgi:hypothetical protein
VKEEVGVEDKGTGRYTIGVQAQRDAFLNMLLRSPCFLVRNHFNIS